MLLLWQSIRATVVMGIVPGWPDSLILRLYGHLGIVPGWPDSPIPCEVSWSSGIVLVPL